MRSRPTYFATEIESHGHDDARQLRVTVDMPDGLRVQEDSAIIVAGLKESPAGPALEERFVLQEIAPDGGSLPAGAQVFRISGSDLQRLETLRAVVRERKRDFPKETRGFLTVTSAGCRTGALPDGGRSMSIRCCGPRSATNTSS